MQTLQQWGALRPPGPKAVDVGVTESMKLCALRSQCWVLGVPLWPHTAEAMEAMEAQDRVCSVPLWPHTAEAMEAMEAQDKSVLSATRLSA